MATNHLKFHILNMVSNKPTKDSIISYISMIFAKSDQELYSPQKVMQQVEHLITTGQIVIDANGIAKEGVGIFEEAEPVSDRANLLAEGIFDYFYHHPQFREAAQLMTAYVVDEFINTLAVIVDSHFPKSIRSSKLPISPKSQKMAKAIMSNVRDRRGFRQPMDMMTKNQQQEILQDVAKIAHLHIFRDKLNTRLIPKPKDIFTKI